MKKVSLGLAVIMIVIVLLSGLAGAQTASPTPVTGIRLSLNLMNLTVGQTDFLRVHVEPVGATPPVLNWSSSNPSVATVQAVSATDARVTGVAPGTAIITVRTADGRFSGSATVTVRTATPTPTPRTGGAALASTILALGLVGSGLLFRRFKG